MTDKRQEQDKADRRERSRGKEPSHIVALGCSAGGLHALEAFFKKLKTPTGLAFVIISHLAPDRKTMMPELIARHTDLEVREAENGMPVEADMVYVIPPGRVMSISGGRLELTEQLADRLQRHPIDHFFRTLARDVGEKAVGIVLSGTGTEGALGLQEIKGQGGMAMVQEPGSARFDGMPVNAIDTGLADFVLAPEEMPGRLMAYIRGNSGQALQLQETLSDEQLQEVLRLIKERNGHDFSNYKPKTIRRRLERRMILKQLEEPDRYIKFLRQQPDEVDHLFQELLIRVTSFFRDAEAYEVLEKKILPAIFQDTPADEEIRVWVAGCSTGEEVYSIAILLDEYRSANDMAHNFRIFATDIDGQAVARARRGQYPETIGVDVSRKRLQRYFTRRNNSYLVNKNIRENIIFAEHNLLKNPPFTRVRLISCRNLLIYLDPNMQKQVLSTFQYALQPGGILFLGSSESLGLLEYAFSPVDGRWKIWRAREDKARRNPLEIPLTFEGPHKRDNERRRQGEERKTPLEELVAHSLLTMYAPPCALVDEDGSILYFHGRTGRYLEPAPGEASFNIKGMAKEGLRKALERALRTAKATGREVVQREVEVKTNGGSERCTLKVRPFREQDREERLFMVIMEEAAPASGEGAAPVPDDEAGGRNRAELETELNSMRQQLQTTVEELEASNEELQSSNEELQSSNEELQSTNEELESSKEELQSVNEELLTSNAELQDKIDQLSQVKDDMNNLLASTDIATLFLDKDLVIKRFTPAVQQHFKLIDTDVGRPLSDIASTLQYPELEEDARQVLRSLVPVQREVEDRRGQWFQVDILPYRTVEDKIEGLVLTFVEITGLKEIELALQETEKRFHALQEQVSEGIVLLDEESSAILDANPAFCRLAVLDREEAVNRRLLDLVPREERQETGALLEAIRGRDGAEKGMELTLNRASGEDGAAVRVRFDARRIFLRDRGCVQAVVREAPGKE